MPSARTVISANADTFSKLRAYSLLLFAAGLGAFFFFRSPRVAAVLGVTSTAGADALGTAAGVLATNAVIVLYVVSAFREPDEPPRGGAAAGGPAAAESKKES
jgi:hypothetical protein